MNTFEEIRNESLKVLEKIRIPSNKNLPILDSSNLRSGREIAVRLIIQCVLAGLSDDVSPNRLKDFLKQNNLLGELNDDDRHFLDTKLLTQEQINELSWKQESVWVLCWIGMIFDDLGLPTKECDLSNIFPHIPPAVDCQKFLSNFVVRDEWEIMKAVDLYYCLHASYNHPELWGNEEFPGSLKIEVLLERRLALEWVIDSSTPWQDISLDT